MTIQANSSGVVAGKFTIPSGLPAGSKRVTFIGAGGSKGDAVFVGTGTITNEVRQQVTTQVVTFFSVNVDPLAQTFSIAETGQIGAVDLWFGAKGTSKVIVQVRETSNGNPTSGIVGEAVLMPSQIAVVGATQVVFQSPIQLLAGIEYALVVMCDDAVTSVRVAELGKWDSANNRWVTSQPYQVGVLLSSSNASTWTAHQDRDLTFRLYKAVFTETNKTVALGTVAVTGATDLMLLALGETPSSSTRLSFTLTLPDASVLTVSSGQPVRLAAAIAGNVTVAAKLFGDASASAVLVPGTQLVVGTVATSATYISQAIPGGAAIKVKAVFDALVPAGSSIVAEFKGGDGGDTWATIPYVSSPAVGDGYLEFTHQITGVTEATVQLRLTLNGTTAARPIVKNIRFMTI